MRLEDLTIALRPRENWEAVDLGCSLVRRDFGRLLGLWSATVLPLWAAMAAMLGNRPAVFMLLVWWLKPLYDRVPLYYISRAAFGERPTMWEAMKAWPRLWTRFPFSALLFRRLSLIRSFALPVWLLEGQRGKAVRQRVRALATDGGGAGFKVTSVFLTFELGILIGLWAMSYNIAPDSGLPEFWDFIVSASNLSDGSTLEVPLFFQWYLITLYLVSLTLVELFYVGAGFGLYLNTRTKLEGWDIELTFRKLAARLRAAALTALIIVGSVIMAEAKSESDHPLAGVEASAPAANPAKKSIQDILAKPEFEIHTRIQKVPVPRHSDSRSVPPVPWLGTVLKLIAWLIVAGLLGLLIWWLVQNRHLFRFSRHGRVKPSVPGPRVVMGMEISRESLPEDLLQTARDAWQRGDLRAALSLLYRGALSRLVEQKRLPIRDSDTEDDCLTHVRKACERPIADYFGRLTRLWEGAAYAGMEAGAADFDFLCSAWPFDGAGTERPGRHRAILLFLLGLSLWSLGACEYREEKITTGYQGKARSDPFLAAQQLLGDYDHDAKKVTSLSKLPEDPEDAVIVISG